MKRLKSRHESFCRHFVDSANAAAAALAAGYAAESARNAGYRLLNQPRIALRIAEIQAETARVHCQDVESLVGKLEVIYRRAIHDHQFSAAARAIELQAKLYGTLTPKGKIESKRSLNRHDPGNGKPADSEAEV